ncbi:hypothetical protein EVAR_76791_1 [Eumeta japonica]|uniref:Uncharacterized protein n=1 Tax=Eumeta variegata TaxID=151549 RepID=A0A4C1SWG6_EUMVA|nr:hypothetical protein EVAR_76791_1 [Eumeta japonica]
MQARSLARSLAHTKITREMVESSLLLGDVISAFQDERLAALLMVYSPFKPDEDVDARRSLKMSLQFDDGAATLK